MSLAALLQDVDGSLGRGTGDERARTLSRLTDLLVGGADGLDPPAIELFDTVIERFASAIETRARVELAERLAPLSNGPRRTIGRLARDEIAVARPVLARSPCLDDQVLMAVATECGRDHMLAICQRPGLSEPVTDVLVAKGDDVVRHAVAGHSGASLSRVAAATLIDRARLDEALQEVLCERRDLCTEHARDLVALAKDTARKRLMLAVPDAAGAVDAAIARGAAGLASRAGGGGLDYPAAFARVATILEERPLAEADVASFAGAGAWAETIAALASASGLPVAALERIFEERDNDLLVVVAKAKGWSWPTLRALLQLRDPRLGERHQFRRAEETFDGLLPATAQRVVHFLKLRENAGPGLARARGERVSGA